MIIITYATLGGNPKKKHLVVCELRTPRKGLKQGGHTIPSGVWTYKRNESGLTELEQSLELWLPNPPEFKLVTTHYSHFIPITTIKLDILLFPAIKIVTLQNFDDSSWEDLVSL
jgi:hypothetical protein